MKDFFRDIFDYHHHFNQKLADLLIEESGQVSERTIPLFSHVVNAHQIWNARILKQKSLGVHDIHPLSRCKDIDTSNHDNTLKILDDTDLGATLKYKTFSGGVFENTIQEVLFHIVNHTTHHRGQIISDLRLHGI